MNVNKLSRDQLVAVVYGLQAQNDQLRTMVHQYEALTAQHLAMIEQLLAAKTTPTPRRKRR